AVYRSARGALEGGVEAAAARGHWRAALGAERTTLTNEWWVRNTFTNSLGFAWKGSDYFDYYRSTRAYGRLERALAAGAWTLAPWVGAQREEAASLAARDPWVLFSPDSVRPNPPVDDGWLTSATAGLDVEWSSPSAGFEGGLELEAGRPEVGEEFGRFLVDGEWNMDALFGHRLEIEGHFRGPLPGTERVPLRRWSMVGDLGTLRTLDAPLRGDRVVWVETEYIIPLPARWRLPLLGAPDLELLHEVGMAWSADERRDFVENIGVRLQFFVVYLRVLTDPSDPVGELKLDLGVSSPF
ncbi:MAG TPA: hypothetical protein VMK65_11860, partial [Longimicrobiales bacterium]|nr:hypothetical protein [Longimicrobiales bacterium]